MLHPWEASDFLRLMLGQKGRCELRIETFGKNAHSAHPEKGKNAIEMMTKVLMRIPQIPCPVSPIVGDGIMVVTDIISRPYPGSSVIADHCQITSNRRTLVGETKESLRTEMNDSLALDFPFPYREQERIPALFQQRVLPVIQVRAWEGNASSQLGRLKRMHLWWDMHGRLWRAVASLCRKGTTPSAPMEVKALATGRSPPSDSAPLHPPWHILSMSMLCLNRCWLPGMCIGSWQNISRRIALAFLLFGK